jgi:hypothetical protein
MAETPNHATTPALEGVNPAIADTVDCAALKEEFGVKSNKHSKNTRGPEKGTSRAQGLQSHHILQDAQTDQIISRGMAIAVILQDSHGGSEHGTITKRQNQRMNNKGGAGGPAATFGALKKEARDDLVAGLEGKRNSNKTGKPMTKKQAEDLADCLVKEAEDAAKAAAKENDEELDDNTSVPPPDGCLTAGTLVWLADGTARPVESLAPGDWLWTPAGPERLVRVDQCRHDLIALDLADASLVIASYHRLMNAAGEWRRADQHLPGDWLATRSGPRLITGHRRLPLTATYRLGFVRATICAIGPDGVLASMPEAGPVVVRTELVQPYQSVFEEVR